MLIKLSFFFRRICINENLTDPTDPTLYYSPYFCLNPFPHLLLLHILQVLYHSLWIIKLFALFSWFIYTVQRRKTRQS